MHAPVQPVPSTPDAANDAAAGDGARARTLRRRIARRAESGAGDRRGAILAIATRRFAEQGFEPTTIRQIADDAHILSGSIYHHFDTKEAMLDEIVRDAVVADRDRTARIAHADADAETRLVALMLLWLGQIETRRDVQAILFQERKFFRRSARFTYVADALQANFQAWCAILDDGIGTARFDPATDVFLTVATINRILNAGAEWYNPGDPHYRPIRAIYSLDRIADFEIRFVLEAIRAQDRKALPIDRAGGEALLARCG